MASSISTSAFVVFLLAQLCQIQTLRSHRFVKYRQAVNNFTAPIIGGGPENPITYGNPPQPDHKLMALRGWMKQALSEVPERQLEARPGPGQWDRTCADQDEVAGIDLAAPKIPRHLHFVLIKERADWVNKAHPSGLIAKDSPAYSKLSGYEQLLIENMRYSIAVNDMKSVHFMDDEACRHACGKWSPELQRLFEVEGDIRFKSDICRVAALYWEGGYHFDDDMLTYHPVSLHEDTELATALGVSGESMFQSFLAAKPCHPTLKRNLELLLEARENPMPGYIKDAMEKDVYLLGPVTLKLAMDEHKPEHTELFNEVRYDPQNATYGPCPDRAGHTCEFVVVDPSSRTMNFCSRF